MKTALRAYAQAYLEAADDPRRAVAAFDACADVIERVSALRAFLAHPSIPASTRREALAVAAPGQPDAAYGLVLLFAAHHRLQDLAAFAQTLRTEAARLREQQHAVVTSAVPLPAPVLRRVTAALTKRFQKEVWLESRVDPSVLAGLHVQVGDWSLDATRRGRLARLEQTLTV